MRRFRPRRGIEWTVLSAILSVGIIPMMVVFVVGYGAARLGRTQEVQRSLLQAAQKTAEGLRFAVDYRFGTAAKLAADSKIVEFLRTHRNAGTDLSDSESKAFSDYLGSLAKAKPEGWSVINVFNTSGSLILSSHEHAKQAKIPSAIREGINAPVFWNTGYSQELERFTMEIAAPVFEPGATTLLGYVSEVSNAQPLLKFVFGYDPERRSGEGSHDAYQIVYGTGNVYVASYLRAVGDTKAPELVREPADPQLIAAINRAPVAESGSLYLPRFSARGEKTSVYLAYHSLFDGSNTCVVVYRPVYTIFPRVNMLAVLALGVFVLIIAVLCTNAYLNVHNNIARPLALLNEGAQIIRQGDLDLKLKIATGDELEELARSFNEMALALKGNIAELEGSEERYRSLVTSMRDGIFQTDYEGVISFLNPAGVELFGFEGVETAVGTPFRRLFSDPADFDRIHRELETKGFLERSRIWMKRRDERLVYVELTANSMHDEAGIATGTEGIFRDVTKNVRLEQEAHERLERIAAINQIANVINSSLEAGRLYESLVAELKKFVEFDYAALSLFAGDEGVIERRQLWPVRGRHSTSATVDEENEKACTRWVVQENKCLIVSNLRMDNQFFASQFPDETASCLCVPLYASGRIMGTLDLGSYLQEQFYIHDASVLEQLAPHVAVAIRNAQLLENLQASLEEVTQAREKLHEVNEELKTLDEMKTNLLSNVSHELRTPLVSVMGYTDMIRAGKAGPISDVQKEYLNISLRNIDRLVTLIENLLDFSRLHRGDETLSFDTFDLVECARGGIEIMRPVAESRELTLELICAEPSVMVEGDRAKLGQIFNNLLSNAVKFNHNGGRVTVEIRLTSDVAEVSVADTGIGIPPEALDKVFTRFYQYDSSSTRKYGGTGIGLSIAQDIARLHGTRISVTSEEGVGSTFRFALPVKAAAKGEGDEPAYSQPAETHLLIELVSSDRALNTQIRNLLESEGMMIITGASFDNAVGLAKKHTPDCMIVDLESAADSQALVDNLLISDATCHLPFILFTNSDEIYARYRSRVAARIKHGFRKSTLLGAIRTAMNPHVNVGEPLGDKILCVDDDAEILTFMGRCLAQGGFQADLCSSGDEALRRVVNREYQLVLLDIAMPGLDGWEACRRIKTNASLAGCKVCMITAKPTETTKGTSLKAGPDGYLLKPFRPEDLVDLVNGMISSGAGADI